MDFGDDLDTQGLPVLAALLEAVTHNWHQDPSECNVMDMGPHIDTKRPMQLLSVLCGEDTAHPTGFIVHMDKESQRVLSLVGFCHPGVLSPGDDRKVEDVRIASRAANCIDRAMSAILLR
jgi:hypothetical protein